MRFYDDPNFHYKSEDAHRDQWPSDGVPTYPNEDFVDESPADSYLRYVFGPLLKDDEAKQGWRGLIETVRRRSGTSHILDLMGGAYCISPDVLADVDSLTGLRLEDISREYRAEIESKLVELRREKVMYPNFEYVNNYLGAAELELKTFDRLQSAQNRSCIYGDVWKRQTWDALDRSMAARNIPRFDLVLCRPSGPFDNDFIFQDPPNQDKPNQDKPNQDPPNQDKPNQDKHISYEMGFIRLLSESVKRVHRDGGTLLTQVPEIFSGSTIERWQKHLRQDERFTTTI